MMGGQYEVQKTGSRGIVGAGWNGSVWSSVDTLQIDQFREEGSEHRPHTSLKIMHDGENLYGVFRVQDRYVLCRHTVFQSLVYEDSCVECFLQPVVSKGYFNFEFNCGGAVLASYVVDSTRCADGSLKGCIPFTEQEGAMINVWASSPREVLPEIMTPCVWELGFAISFELLEKYVGHLRPVEGQVWRANFFKCANACSHPHWASWAPLTARNFHLPNCFGDIVLGE